MTAPVLRATLESGAVWEDPSEDLLFELLEDIERGDELFVLIEETFDASGQTYIQAIQDDSGGWLVERRDGDPASHYRATVTDLRTAHALLTAWAFRAADLSTLARWERVTV